MYLCGSVEEEEEQEEEGMFVHACPSVLVLCVFVSVCVS